MTTHIIQYLNSSDFKEFLEKLFYVSGIIVAVASLLGLRQLTLFKKDIVLRNTRAARERAIECAGRYIKFNELIGIYSSELQKAGLAVYEGPIGNFTKASIPKIFMPTFEKRLAIPCCMDPLNVLEIIAATFISGVADEQTAFTIFGPSFCASVEFNYDIISSWREDETSDNYLTIIQLYRVWSPRISRENLDKQRREIESRIQSLPSMKIHSIGCE